MKMEVIGIHPVDATQPAHLIELRISEICSPLDIGVITQELLDQPRDNWQAPWDEHFLTDDGTNVLDPTWPEKPPDDNSARVAFFFHYLDLEKPLLTPAGPLAMPAVTETPRRLRFMKYEDPW